MPADSWVDRVLLLIYTPGFADCLASIEDPRVVEREPVSENIFPRT